MIEPIQKPKHELELENMLDLFEKPELKKVFIKAEAEYLYWDKVKYIVPRGIDPRDVWEAIRFKRSLQLETVSFGNHKFRFAITNHIQNLLHEFDMNMGGLIGGNSSLSQSDQKVFLISSIMEEAIASSQMEGASTTRRIAKDMLRKKLKPTNRSQQMITNNYQTIQQLVDGKTQLLDMDMLLNIHHSITTKTLDDPEDEGRLRKDDNIMVMNEINGDIAHIPPTHTEIEEMLKDLFVFANTSTGRFIHPIIKGIIIHYVLAWIHPFVDGNGRTARSLFYWYMIKSNYWATEYLSISRIIYKSKGQYERAFQCTENDGMDMTYFILYNINILKKAMDELTAYLARKAKEKVAMLESAGSEVSERQLDILRILTNDASMILTPNEVSTRFNVCLKTARADLKELADTGKIKKILLTKKKVGYISTL